MVGILLVTHDNLGDGFVDCVKHVLGEVPRQLKVLQIAGGDDPEHKLREGEQLVKQLDTGSGVLILADIFGATPSNVARRLCHAERVRGVAGLNLPMLLRVVCHPNKNLAELAQLALEGGRDCIVYIDKEH